MNLWTRQLGAVLRLEWRKTFFSKRGWWIYLLALGPVVITALHWLFELGRPSSHHSLGDDSIAYAAMFHFFYLRGAIFFGCVGIFMSLFRAEMQEHTLHYYYLTPLRREMLVAGKYLAGLGHGRRPVRRQRRPVVPFHRPPLRRRVFELHLARPGLGQLGWYTLTAALAAVGYGAVFLMCGLLFRNPFIPAAVVYVWEALNPFLPGLLKKVSVIFYLKNLYPVEVPLPPPLNLLVVETDPTPAWLAIPGLLAVSLLLLIYTAYSARQGEISYGE
jgi:hypothetical protein